MTTVRYPGVGAFAMSCHPYWKSSWGGLFLGSMSFHLIVGDSNRVSLLTHHRREGDREKNRRMSDVQAVVEQIA